MKEQKNTANNMKQFLVTIIVSPIVWFGTFGKNQMCMNFTYFFTVLVSVLFIGCVITKEKIIETLDPECFSNDFLHAFTWLIPASILIASGNVFLGSIWFFYWCLRSSYRSEIRKNVEK